MIPPAVYLVVTFGAIFVMSVVLHEVAHGYVAYRCGDPTAYMMGRLTLNPIKHIDPVFTLLMPAVLLWLGLPALGGAKPVPVNRSHFRNPVRDDVMVSLAGVTVNFAIAWLLAMVLHLLVESKLITWQSPHAVVLGMAIVSNLALMVFNLIPVPPLDGSHVLRHILPSPLREIFEQAGRFGLIIIYALIMLGLGRFLILVVALLWEWVLRFELHQLDEVLRGFVAAFR